MGAFEGDKGDAVVDTVIEKMKWRSYVDVAKALPAELLEAITEAVGWMKKNASEEGAPTEAIGRVVAFLGKVADGKFPEGEGKEKEGEGDDDNKDDVDKQDKCPKCGAEMVDGACSKCEYKASSDEDANKGASSEDGLTVRITPGGEVEISGQPVAKGSKGFTTERTETFKTAVTGLLGMLADVDADGTRAIIEEMVKALSGDLKWKPGTVAAPASLKKELGDLVTSAITEATAPLKKGLEDLGGKVETITKGRGAPQSGDGDDDTTKTDVNKGESFWDGVPISKG